MARVYLSSSFQDLRPERAAVTARLRGAGHVVVAMEDYPVSIECPTSRCRADVASSDVYLGLFARRYGYVPRNESIAITEIEYRAAMAACEYSAIFLLDDAINWPDEWTDRFTGNGGCGIRIETLRRELCERHEVRTFTCVADLTEGVTTAVPPIGW